MEATKLIEALSVLRGQFDKPPSDLEIIRHALQEKLARASGVEMPPLLNAEQRGAFVENIDRIEEFLSSEDGADAVELLMRAWAAFVAPVETGEEEQAE